METWTLKGLKEKRDLLASKYNASSDKFVKDNLLCIINSMDKLLEDLDGKCETFYQSDLFKRANESDMELIDNFPTSLDIIRDSITRVSAMLEDFYTPRKPLKRINASDSIIRVTKDFYGTLKGNIEEYVPLMFNSRTKLNLRPNRRLVKNYGLTFKFSEDSDIYVLLQQVHNINDYVTSFHEFGHVLSLEINPNELEDIFKYLFIELEAIFFELIGSDYLVSKGYSERDILTLDVIRLLDYLGDAKLLVSKLSLLSEYGELNFEDISEYKRYLLDVCKVDKRFIKNILFDPMYDTIHYIISYLTAIEFYLKYLVNPTETLDSLLNFTSTCDLDIDDYFRILEEKGIIIGKHLGDYIDLLKGRVKEEEHGKELRLRKED